MSKSEDQAKAGGPGRYPAYPAVYQGTGLVDRINLSLHLRRYIKLVAGRWWLLILGALIGGGISSYRAFNKPDTYRKYSILTIKPKISTGMSRAQYLEELSNFFDNQLQFLRSREIHGRVEAKILEERPTLVRPDVLSLTAKRGIGSSLELVVSSSDLEYARLYAKHWAQVFTAFKDEQVQEEFQQEAFQINQDIIAYERRLSSARANLKDFREDKKIGTAQEAGAFAQKELDTLLAQQAAVTRARKILENTTAEDIAVTGLLGNEGSGGSGAGSSGSDIAAAGAEGRVSTSGVDYQKFNDGSRYRELQRTLRTREPRYEDLGRTLKPKHPMMLALSEEIDGLKRQLEIELRFIRESREALLQTYVQSEASYAPLIEQQRQKVIETRSVQDDYMRLLEEERDIKQTLTGLRASLDAIDRGDREGRRFRVAEEAAGGEGPVWGNRERRKMILLGTLVGALCGLGVAYYLQRLDDRLDIPSEIEEALGETVVGQIPQVDTSSLGESPLIITRLSQHNMFSEAIRGVRSAILLGADGGSKQIMLVSSAVPGDGKTTFTTNFAATLALAGNRVLLVDADLRRGNIERYFNHERGMGLTEVLTGKEHWEDVLKGTEDLPTLDLITTGDMPPNPGELLVGPITWQFFSEVKQKYDYIIVDCPPLTAIDDTFVLANLADGLLFVVRAGQTSMRFANNALDAVRQRGARLLGVVVNGITADNPYYYYNNYYHAYYTRNQDDTVPVGTAQGPAVEMAVRKGRERVVASTNRESEEGGDGVPASGDASGDEPGVTVAGDADEDDVYRSWSEHEDNRDKSG